MRSRVKRLLAFSLAAALAFSLAACGGVVDNLANLGGANSAAGADSKPGGGARPTAAPQATPDAGPSSTSATAPVHTPDPQPQYRLNSAMGFSGGYAVIQFYDEAGRTSYNGVIDPKGKLHAYYSGSLSSSFDRCKNGYMYEMNNNDLRMIAPDGKVTTFEGSSDLRFPFYGDGYVVTEEHKAGFDAVEYIYHIYDGSGKELSSYSTGSRQVSQLRYAGEGVFLFQPYIENLTQDQRDARNSYGYYADYFDLFFAQGNSWKNSQLVNTDAFAGLTCRDGIFLYRGASYAGGDRNTHKGEFTYANVKGETTSFTVPEEIGLTPFCLACADGVMLFRDTSSANVLYRYEISGGKWTRYEGKYLDKLYWSSNYAPVTGDGYTAICLIGADNKVYTMLLDKDMKDLLDAPIPGGPRAVRDGVLYIADQDSNTLCHCYDLKGKELGEVPNVDPSLNWMEEKILLSQQAFVKPDGSPAFEIDYSSGKLVTLPE